MYRILLVICISLTFSISYGANIFSNGTGGGDWALGASWVGGIAPGVGDQAFIVGGDNITVSSPITVLNAIINNNSSTLTVNVGITLTVTDWMYINGTAINESVNIVNNGTINCVRMTVKDFSKINFSLNVSGSGTINCSTHGEYVASTIGMSVSMGNKLLIGTDFHVQGSALTFSLTDSLSCSRLILRSGTLDISSNSARMALSYLIYSSGTILSNSTSSSRVYFNSFLGITDNVNINWPNVFFIGSCSLGSDLTSHSATINTGGSLAIGGSELTLSSGSFTNAGTFSSTTGGKITLSGAAAQTIGSSSTMTLHNLEIANTSGGVSIDAGELEISEQISFDASSNTVFTTNDKLKLLDEGSGMANLGNLHNHTISGNITCQYKTNTLTTRGYRTLSMPVSGVTIGDIQYHATNQTGGFDTWGFTGSNTPSAGGYFSTYTYNNASVTGDFDEGWIGATNTTNSLGHQQATNWYIGPYTGGGGTSYSFEVSGAPNTGSKPIDKANGANLDYDAGNAADNNYNWALVGNPYPSTVDFSSATKSNVEATCYIFKSDGGGYSADATIPPFQGFYVRTSGSIASITFEEADKVTTQKAFQKADKNDDFLEMYITSDQTDKYSYGKLRFTTEGTSDYDKSEDAFRLKNPAPWPNIALMSSDGEPLQHYTGPTNEGHNVISINTITYESGTHTIRFDHIENVEGCIILEDLIENKMITIDSDNKSYSFYLSNTVKADRFKLHVYNFTKEITTTHSSCFNKNDGTTEIELFDIGLNYNFNLIDNNGNAIATKSKVNGKQQVKNLTPGNYTFEILANGLTCSSTEEYFTILEPSEMVPAFDFKENAVVFYNNQEVEFENNSTGGIANYVWDFGDGNFDSRKNPVHIYSEPGNYNINLTAQNGNVDCDVTSSRSIKVVDAYVSVSELSVSKVKVLQSGQNLNVSVENKFEEFKIVDLSGKMVLQGNIENQNDFDVNLSEMENGIYILHLIGNDKPYTLKFYKK